MLYLLSTPIGNIADITIRALEVLQNCDKILCEDTRNAKKLVSLLNNRNLLKKLNFTYISMHSHNEDTRLFELGVEFFIDDVIFMSDAGMPCISDPGAKLVHFAQTNNIPYTILPGASSMLSAFCLSGIDSKEFVFLGFFPHKLQEKIKFITNTIMPIKYPCISLESSHRILETLELLSQIIPNAYIFVVKEITKVYERFYYGSSINVYEELKSANINGEWVIVIEAIAKEARYLSLEDIKSITMPPKVKAKILSKLSGKSVKVCYERLIEEL